VTAQKTEIKVWKTITLGATDKTTLVKRLTEKKILNEKSSLSNHLDSIKIGQTRAVKLAVVSIEDLGTKEQTYTGDYIDYKKICALAKKKGLKLCPREVLLQLPLLLTQADGFSYWSNIVAIEPIKELYPYSSAKYYFQYVYGIGYNSPVQAGSKEGQFFFYEVTFNGDTAEGGDQSDQFETSKFIFVVP
jgi:hypothetical protein